jgi:hypothetical protein
MALRHLTLHQIDETQPQQLIEGRAAETRDIDHKRDPYGNADKDYGEFLADISSFANTPGGDIIIGMAAKASVPISFAPLIQRSIGFETVLLLSTWLNPPSHCNLSQMGPAKC